MIAEIPGNEAGRLRALQRYLIMDTKPETEFDRVVSLAARLFEVPVATVTLVSGDRQWYKACHGTGDLRETTRDISMCAHAILSREMTVVPDVRLDSRFADNPFVTGAPFIRFYAAMPLVTGDGFVVGTLCLVDVRPRDFGQEQRAILRDLAGIVMEALQMRLSMLEKNQLAAAIMNVSSGMVVTDPSREGNPIIFCNPAFTGITGYDAGEVIGRNCKFLQGPDTDPAMIAEMRRAQAERRVFHGLLVNYKRNGDPFWNELTISPVFGPDGRLVNFVGLQNDVTRRKRAEESAAASYEQLKKLEGLRDNLTNMIIHDMRQPLAVTMGFLSVLKITMEGRNEPRAMEAILHAEEGAEQLNGMITSLLDVSRLEAGQMPMDIREWDLCGLARDSMATSLALHGNSRLKLELPATPVPVRCDAGLISRVISNLVGNALKYTGKEGGVRVRIERQRAQAMVSVIDCGPGIPEEYQQKIFEKFSQVDKDRRVHSTGLGLTFCKLVVEAHGGTIGVRSEVGRGSTFQVSLPPADTAPVAHDLLSSDSHVAI